MSLKYIISRSIVLILRGIIKIPFAPKVLKEIVVAGSNGYAKREFEKKHYTKAFKEVKAVVDLDINQNDPYLARARYIISYLYQCGYGTTKNTGLAKKYLVLSAEAGDEIAIKQLQHIKNNVGA